MAIDTLDAFAPPIPPVRSRRALLTAALGGLGGLFASRLGAPSPAAAAAGDPLLIGNTTNTAGTANTTLTTASTGTALLVTQNGTGTALRGSAVGAGSIAGFFTAANGTGISGVTGNPNSYGVFGSNDGAGGAGAAIRASGKNNDGLSATTDSATKAAIKASNAGAAGMGAAVQAIGGNNTGLDASTANDNVPAVRGSHNGFGGVGVRGSSANGYGVYGESTNGYGVRGISAGGLGVSGYSSSNYGVSGQSATGIGARGYSTGSIGVAGQSGGDVGVYGYTDNVDSSAGYFEGLMTATTKNFRIDHPVDPAGKVLVHSCVESNERKLVYDGVVTTDRNGEATIELPGYFDALNRDLRYQLTPLADARAWVKRKVAGNRFTVATSEPGTEVCWQLTGVRQDAYAKAHPLVVEAAKTGKEKGRYLNPREHGQPESKGVYYEHREAASRSAASG
jgi:hypothetical protein